jgi:hypothetical protein
VIVCEASRSVLLAVEIELAGTRLGELVRDMRLELDRELEEKRRDSAIA